MKPNSREMWLEVDSCVSELFTGIGNWVAELGVANISGKIDGLIYATCTDAKRHKR